MCKLPFYFMIKTQRFKYKISIDICTYAFFSYMMFDGAKLVQKLKRRPKIKLNFFSLNFKKILKIKKRSEYEVSC